MQTCSETPRNLKARRGEGEGARRCVRMCMPLCACLYAHASMCMPLCLGRAKGGGVAGRSTADTACMHEIPLEPLERIPTVRY